MFRLLSEEPFWVKKLLPMLTHDHSPQAENHLFDSIFGRVRSRDKVAMRTDSGRTLTYADLIELSGQMAHALVKMGVRPNDRVVAQVEKSSEVIGLYLGCLRAGAIFVPLNTAYTAAEVEYFLSDAEPQVFVCDSQREDLLGPVARQCNVPNVVTLDAGGDGSLSRMSREMPSAFPTIPRTPDDIAAILYTSGTTGRSKGAMLSHDNLASNTAVLVDYWRFTAEDVLIHALPIFHTHGLFVGVQVTLMAGGTMIFMSKFDPSEVLKHIPQATVLMGVPTFYTRLLADPRLDRDLTKSMRVFISGSAPLLANIHHQWKERTGHAILERYGMTETTMTTSNPYDGERRPGTVGFALPGIEIRVVDQVTGEQLEAGEIGMLEVRGPNVFKGYWRMEEKTRSEFRSDGFFITGDLALVDDLGYLHIVGRGKDLIITGGYNVYPKEIETEIDALPGVVESAVIGIPDADFGESVTAVIVPERSGELTEEHIRQTLGHRLARFKLPKRIFFVKELPRNAMGKVQKNVLRDIYAKPD